MAAEDPVNCKLASVSYRESTKGKDVPVGLSVEKGVVISKSSGQKYIPPQSGVVTIQFSHSTTVPTLSIAAEASAMAVRPKFKLRYRSDLAVDKCV